MPNSRAGVVDSRSTIRSTSDPPRSDAARVGHREQRFDARGAVRDLGEWLTGVALLDGQPVGHVVRRHQVQVTDPQRIPERVLVSDGP